VCSQKLPRSPISGRKPQNFMRPFASPAEAAWGTGICDTPCGMARAGRPTLPGVCERRGSDLERCMALRREISFGCVRMENTRCGFRGNQRWLKLELDARAWKQCAPRTYPAVLAHCPTPKTWNQFQRYEKARRTRIPWLFLTQPEVGTWRPSCIHRHGS